MLRKLLFTVMTFGVLVLAVGCGNEKNDERGQVESEIKQVLADGSEVIVPSIEADEELTNWLMEKQIELQQLITDELALKKQSAAIMITKVSAEEVYVSVVLDSEQEFDEKSIQKVVEKIIDVFLEQDNISIKEENIIITDGKANILY